MTFIEVTKVFFDVKQNKVVPGSKFVINVDYISGFEKSHNTTHTHVNLSGNSRNDFFSILETPEEFEKLLNEVGVFVKRKYNPILNVGEMIPRDPSGAV